MKNASGDGRIFYATETVNLKCKWVSCLIVMSKAVSNVVSSVLESKFGMNKERRYIGCDDGTTYVFIRQVGSPRWRSYLRISADGDMSVEPSRLPAAIKAHMDGITQSGKFGGDSKQYWVK